MKRFWVLAVWWRSSLSRTLVLRWTGGAFMGGGVEVWGTQATRDGCDRARWAESVGLKPCHTRRSVAVMRNE